MVVSAVGKVSVSVGTGSIVVISVEGGVVIDDVNISSVPLEHRRTIRMMIMIRAVSRIPAVI